MSKIYIRKQKYYCEVGYPRGLFMCSKPEITDIDYFFGDADHTTAQNKLELLGKLSSGQKNNCMYEAISSLINEETSGIDMNAVMRIYVQLYYQ